MRRFADLLRRLGQAEAAKLPDVPVPHVLLVGINEMHTEAHARFAATWPNRKPGQAVLVVPAKPRNVGEEALYEERLFASQMTLVANVRRDSR